MKVYAIVETECAWIQLITHILMNSLFSSNLVNNNHHVMEFNMVGWSKKLVDHDRVSTRGSIYIYIYTNG